MMYALEPYTKHDVNCNNSPIAWKNGMQINIRSSGVISKLRPDAKPNKMQCAWGIITPFDGPVVPEVNIIAHMSRAFAGTISAGLGSVVKRSSN